MQHRLQGLVVVSQYNTSRSKRNLCCLFDVIHIIWIVRVGRGAAGAEDVPGCQGDVWRGDPILPLQLHSQSGREPRHDPLLVSGVLV